MNGYRPTDIILMCLMLFPPISHGVKVNKIFQCLLAAIFADALISMLFRKNNNCGHSDVEIKRNWKFGGGEQKLDDIGRKAVPRAEHNSS